VNSATAISDHAKWWRPISVPLDRDGPVLLPFDVPSADFVESSVFELFERVALATPGGAAINDGKTTLTYAEVLGEVKRLAGAVAAQVPAGRAVAVLLPNAPSSLIAVLACVAAQRCCLVLNADHPVDRNAAILGNADVYAAISTEASILPDGTVRIDFSATAAAAAPWTGTASHRPDDPAIVLYTSGSEGQPKGIVLSQVTVLTRVRNNIVAMHLGPSDRFLSLGALGTTAGLVASLVALLGGALQFVVSVSAAGASNLLGLIRENRVTIVWGVPALMGLLFEDRQAAEALESLRMIRTFGDRLLSTECAAWRATLPSTCHLAITYGQTEATIAQAYLPRHFVSDVAALPTGYLLPEHEYAILADDGSPAAEGEVGELVVRSRFVALGEWMHGEVVPGRLQRDPVDARQRILPTGDLVLLRPDRLLQVIGRVDRQVKINGHRVEPAEIENALRRVRGVSDAAIAVRRDGDQTSLIAFVVARDRSDRALLDRARKAIRILLPGYMQPARLLLAGALPLLPGGKVDHRALLKIEVETPLQRPVLLWNPWRRSRSRPLHPSNGHGSADTTHETVDTERAVTLAWRRVLRSAPAPNVTFLDAAGDYLRLLELVFELESLTRRRLPLDAFNVEATAAQMALALDAVLRDPPPSPANERVFLLPGARGDTPGLAGLRADCLPVVSIQMVTYPGWREMLRISATFDGIAEAAASQVRAMSLPGPVCLVGYSFGAHVAYAVCCMLESEGRDVAQLVLIDMPPPRRNDGAQFLLSPETMLDVGHLRNAMRKMWWSANRLVRAMREGTASEHVGMLVASMAATVVRGWGPRALRASGATKGWSQHLGDLGYWTGHHLSQELRLKAANEWARRWCAPATRLRAPLLLVLGEAHRPNASEDLGWSEIAEHVQVVRVQGTHVTMLSAAHRSAVSTAVRTALADTLNANPLGRA